MPQGAQLAPFVHPKLARVKSRRRRLEAFKAPTRALVVQLCNLESCHVSFADLPRALVHDLGHNRVDRRFQTR